jgi:hypothetical protein
VGKEKYVCIVVLRVKRKHQHAIDTLSQGRRRLTACCYCAWCIFILFLSLTEIIQENEMSKEFCSVWVSKSKVHLLRL